jgi:hypothetical protein
MPYSSYFKVLFEDISFETEGTLNSFLAYQGLLKWAEDEHPIRNDFTCSATDVCILVKILYITFKTVV